MKEAIALCNCGPLRRPGEVSPLSVVVNCSKCGLWIEPPEQDRVAFILDGACLVQTDNDGIRAEVLVISETGGKMLAKGHAETIQGAITALEWAEGEQMPNFPLVAKEKLIEAAHYNPTSGPVPDGLACLGSLDLATGVLTWARDMPKPPWGVESYSLDTGMPTQALHDSLGDALAVSVDPKHARRASTLQGLAFIRQAAPILAERMKGMAGLLQECVDFADYMAIIPKEIGSVPHTAHALREKAEKLGFKPGGDANRPEGAPYCPNCSSFMRPWPLRVPDPKSGQTGRVPGHLVKMVTVHAWRCNCAV